MTGRKVTLGWEREGGRVLVTTEPVPVEILHTPGCGRWGAARAAVKRVGEEEEVAVTISERLIDSLDLARASRFAGSPTVRVRGRDVQPEADELEDFGLG